MFKIIPIAAIAAGFANTNASSTFYVCATPQNADLDQSGFEALSWVEVGAVGQVGETGENTNILSYDTWNTDVIQKGKGMTNAGDPTLETARIADDAGQVIMRAAGATNFNYAFKIVGNDKPNDDPASRSTTRYNRGLVTGPTEPNGRNEDFDLEVYTLGLQQRQIKVAPVDGTV